MHVQCEYDCTCTTFLIYYLLYVTTNNTKRSLFLEENALGRVLCKHLVCNTTVTPHLSDLQYPHVTDLSLSGHSGVQGSIHGHYTTVTFGSFFFLLCHIHHYELHF